MQQACGGIEYLEGGVIKNTTVVSSYVTGSTITDSSLEASTIKTLQGIDEVSTQVVANALASLPKEKLQQLAHALMSALAADAEPPASTEAAGLPTTVFGNRAAVLGAPAHWLTLADGTVVPAYTAE